MLANDIVQCYTKYLKINFQHVKPHLYFYWNETNKSKWKQKVTITMKTTIIATEIRVEGAAQLLSEYKLRHKA